ncbi:hypothetical protein ACFE33_03430 [Falsihalocynthiibacter sp. SS001]|uniref:hypothetical protein n=1 Tax=Falsihalocynthiibacter sp. SS001 TaxID=3349698 RepID=UPI0036D38B69
MRYSNLQDFLQNGAAILASDPIAILLIEDDVEVDSTIRHHFGLGFKTILVFGAEGLSVPHDLEAQVHTIAANLFEDNATQTIVNAINDRAIGQWIYYCYNAEYLFFPFCESRTVGEMLTFHMEERRGAVLSYVVDLYASDLARFPNAVSVEEAHFDKTGYYALARTDPINKDHIKDRQNDFFGGLRWRFEEHIPLERRKIDRISIFRAKAGLRLLDKSTFSDEEYNTYSCPWHHNITAAICSFRTAKALKLNPGSTFAIETFRWHNTTPFEWNSQQLLDLGLIEPGQWF